MLRNIVCNDSVFENCNHHWPFYGYLHFFYICSVFNISCQLAKEQKEKSFKIFFKERKMKKLLEFLFCRMFKGIMFVVYAYSIQNIEEVCAWYEIELFILVSTRMFFQIFHLQHFDFFLLYQNGSFILSNLFAQNTQ